MMKRVIFMLILAFVLLTGTASTGNTASTVQDVTEEEVVQFLMAPARNAEEQAVKDRLVWMLMAEQMANDLQ
ncbi:MAG: hypothetical protein KDE47_04985 [Caldilineaceae bacterium]|nr:hypothetical protein [Caldilineaceae bacterium]